MPDAFTISAFGRARRGLSSAAVAVLGCALLAAAQPAAAAQQAPAPSAPAPSAPDQAQAPEQTPAQPPTKYLTPPMMPLRPSSRDAAYAEGESESEEAVEAAAAAKGAAPAEAASPDTKASKPAGPRVKNPRLKVSEAPPPTPEVPSAGATPPGTTPPSEAAATSGTAAPADGTSPDTRALDEQVQELKKDVVDLNRDLFVLEEELLFPANTQVAVFLAVDVGDFFALDSVQLRIDRKEVINYMYTPREVDALLKGGVQRLYLGNLKVGPHELVAFFNGKGPNDRPYKRGASLHFEKGIGAKYLELKIDDRQRKLQPEFEIKDWE